MGSDAEQDENILQRIINRHVSAAMEPRPPNETLMKLQQPFADAIQAGMVRPAAKRELPVLG